MASFLNHLVIISDGGFEISRRLIESDDIYKILPEINDASASEKQGGGRPPFWEMVAFEGEIGEVRRRIQRSTAQK